ncbi:hypothetical protein [uncultured Roseibium sp.]|uniref:hypothetical protein n=1 Tax=uncultured Roseibium sp. TaxID=1936171 RepID=UPI003216BCC3
MSQKHRDELKALFQTPCINVIGFYQLLEQPEPGKFDPVKQMQHRAYMVGSGLKVAEMILRYDDVFIELFPHKREQIDRLRRHADEIQRMAVMLDGDSTSRWCNRLYRFAGDCIAIFDGEKKK